jgi:hypothetical protein
VWEDRYSEFLVMERDHLGDSDVDGCIILIWFFEKYVGRALTGVVWQGLVNSVMNLPVPNFVGTIY